MFDAKTRARQPGEPARLRRLVRRPRRRRRAHGRGGAAPVRAPRAGRAQPRRPAAPSCRTSSRSSATRRASSPRSRRPTRGLFTTMADTWEAVGRDPEALQPVHLQAARRRWTPRSRRSGSSARSCAELTTFSKDFSGATERAARRAARHQPGARDRHARPAQRARAQRAARGHVRRARGPDLGAVDQRRDPRADRDGHHAQPAAALLRPVRHGLQRPELLLHLPRRALLRGRQHRPVAARAAQLRRPAGRLARLDGRRRAGQRPARSSRATSSTCTATRTARRSRPTGAPTARPASAATSSATPASTTSKFKIEQDARTPGAQGPTYKGRARVPKGQTYTSIPETGPYAEIAPSSSGER